MAGAARGSGILHGDSVQLGQAMLQGMATRWVRAAGS